MFLKMCAEGLLNWLGVSYELYGLTPSRASPLPQGMMLFGESALANQLRQLRVGGSETINHMHAIPRNILRMMLRLRSHFRELAGIQFCAGLGVQVDDADR